MSDKDNVINITPIIELNRDREDYLKWLTIHCKQVFLNLPVPDLETALETLNSRGRHIFLEKIYEILKKEDVKVLVYFEMKHGEHNLPDEELIYEAIEEGIRNCVNSRILKTEKE